MKKQVFICDKCDIQIPDNEKMFLFSLFHERRTDPAGSSDDWNYQSDLCLNCTVILADRLMKFIDKSDGIVELFKMDLVKQFNAVSK